MSHDHFLKKIQEAITTHLEAFSYLDNITLWETLKKEVVTLCKELSASKAQAKKGIKNRLLSILDTISKDIDTHSHETPDDTNEIQVLSLFRSEIEASYNYILGEEARKHVFLSKCKWAREGDKPTKYFFSLEKRNFLSKNMKSIRNSEGNIVSSQKGILREQQRFYESLYTANKEVVFSIPSDSVNNKLNSYHRALLEAPISENEIFKCIKAMAANKTPGMDGLTKEFYETFFPELKAVLVPLYEQILKENCLNPSTRKGVFALLPKKGKDLLFLKSLRPLTLLNNDYKILAKVLAECMKVVLPDIISEEQTGFMQNRNICENLRRTLETIEYTRNNKKAGLIISIDFEKCFDMVAYGGFGNSTHLGFWQEIYEMGQYFLQQF